MELIKNIVENEFGEMVGEVYFKYINRYIRLRFEQDVPMEYVYKNVELLNEIQEKTINDICKYSISFCKDTLESYPDMEIEIDIDNFENNSDIMKYMKFEELVVNLPEDMSEQGINLGGSCEWDKENGIQWLIKDDIVVYVGPWDDLDIWYSPYEEDDICNYVVRQED